MTTIRRRHAVFGGLLMTTCLLADAETGLLKSEFVFETSPFSQCHASTIAETKAGLVAARFGGTRERHPDEVESFRGKASKQP